MEIINVTLNDGSKHSVDFKTKVGDLQGLQKETDFPFIAALVNNQVRSLSYKLDVTSHVEFLTVESQIGKEIYRRSLSFLLAKACYDIYPDCRLVISHSLGHGYYYELIFPDKKDNKYIEKLYEKMHLAVGQNLPIVRKRMSYEDALQFFKESGQQDKYNLLLHKNSAKIIVHFCESYFEICYRVLVENTKYLSCFGLKEYENGFLMRFPRSINPGKLSPFCDERHLFHTYQEHKKWGKILKVDSVGSLNNFIRNDEISDFIKIAEALHEKKVAGIADEILKKKQSIKLITIAGPSSSGKTTFSKRLMIQLRVNGLKPIGISMDDYFLDRDKTPRDKDGKYDFESLKAIDVTLLNQNLLDLFSGKQIKLPIYNFKTGKREYREKTLKIDQNNIIIIEGIHGLNDELTYLLDKSIKYKIYVSALTQINLDDTNRISTTDNRLLRRIVRDARFRGHDTLFTLQMWPKVRQGEVENIFPYQGTADATFNSALDYEISVLKNFAVPLLKQVKSFHKLYYNAVRLLGFLDNFLPILPDEVPLNSILREFIGGSSFRY